MVFTQWECLWNKFSFSLVYSSLYFYKHRFVEQVSVVVCFFPICFEHNVFREELLSSLHLMYVLLSSVTKKRMRVLGMPVSVVDID